MNSIDGVIMLASTNRADILDKVRDFLFRFLTLGLADFSNIIALRQLK